MKELPLLAIDWGKKRVGIALSYSGSFSSPGFIIKGSMEKRIDEIKKLIQKEGIKKIVLGLPKTKKREVKEIKKFAQKLKEKVGLPIVFEDETLTSKEAERLLTQQGFSIPEIKKRIDALSAQLILEQYLGRFGV